VLHALREDEVFAQAHGKNTLYFKVTAFAVSAALAAMAGSLYATLRVSRFVAVGQGRFKTAPKKLPKNSCALRRL